MRAGEQQIKVAASHLIRSSSARFIGPSPPSHQRKGGSGEGKSAEFDALRAYPIAGQPLRGTYEATTAREAKPVRSPPLWEAVRSC